MLLVISSIFFFGKILNTHARNKYLFNELIHVLVRQIVCFEIKSFEIPKI